MTTEQPKQFVDVLADSESTSFVSESPRSSFSNYNANVGVGRGSSRSSIRGAPRNVCGFVVMKRFKIPKKWKRRFLVLDPLKGEVQVFRNDQEFMPKKIINLLDVEEELLLKRKEFDEKKNRYKFVLLKHTNKKASFRRSQNSVKLTKYRFSVDNEEERDRWVDDIMRVIQSKKMEQQVRTWINTIESKKPEFERSLRQASENANLKIVIDYESFPRIDASVYKFFFDGELFKFLAKSFREMYATSSANQSSRFRTVEKLVVKCKKADDQSRIDSDGVMTLLITPHQITPASSTASSTASTSTASTSAGASGADWRFTYIGLSELKKILDKAKFNIEQRIQRNEAFLTEIERIRNIVGPQRFQMIGLEWGVDGDSNLENLDAFVDQHIVAITRRIADAFEKFMQPQQSQFAHYLMSIFGGISVAVDTSVKNPETDTLVRIQSSTHLVSDDVVMSLADMQISLPEKVYQVSVERLTRYFEEELFGRLQDFCFKRLSRKIHFSLDWNRITSVLTSDIEICQFLEVLQHQLERRVMQYLNVWSESPLLARAVANYVSRVVITVNRTAERPDEQSAFAAVHSAPVAAAAAAADQSVISNLDATATTPPMATATPTMSKIQHRILYDCVAGIVNKETNTIEEFQFEIPDMAMWFVKFVEANPLPEPEKERNVDELSAQAAKLEVTATARRVNSVYVSDLHANNFTSTGSDGSVQSSETPADHSGSSNGSAGTVSKLPLASEADSTAVSPTSAPAGRKRGLSLNVNEQRSHSADRSASVASVEDGKTPTKMVPFDSLYPVSAQLHSAVKQALHEAFQPTRLADKDCETIIEKGLKRLRHFCYKHDRQLRGELDVRTIGPLVREYLLEYDAGDRSEASTSEGVNKTDDHGVEVNKATEKIIAKATAASTSDSDSNNAEKVEVVAFEAIASVLLVDVLPKLVKQSIERRRDVILFGLANAGKTMLVQRLKFAKATTGASSSNAAAVAAAAAANGVPGTPMKTKPSIGTTTETLAYKSLNLTIHDIAGGSRERSDMKYFIEKYQDKLNAMVFVLDVSTSSNTTDQQLEDARSVLKQIVKAQKQISRDRKPLLILANKKDATEATVTESELEEKLKLAKIKSNYVTDYKLQFCSIMHGEGVTEAMDWLYTQLLK